MCRRRNDPRVLGHVGTACRAVDTARDAAAPERHAHSLWARRGGVAGDHAQVVRERAHLGERPAPVVDGRALRKHGRRSLVQRRHPVGGRVVWSACTSSRRSEAIPKWEKAFVVRFPTNVCWCDAPGLPGKTIGSSGALVAEAAVLDEVHADEVERAISRSARRPASACLRAPPVRAPRRLTSMRAPTVISATPLTAISSSD